MKKILCLTLMMIMTVFSTTAMAVDWRFPLEITYMSGFSDVVDYYEYKTGGDASWNLPVGLAFGPYVQFDHGSMIGGKLGPLAYISVDCIGYGCDGADESYFDVPLKLYYGFTFIPKANISPYVKAGLSYHIISADSVDDSSPGFYGAVGVEFMRTRAVGLGLEIAYDTAELNMDYYRKDIKPGDLLVSFLVIF
ncbi:MAG: outer membrane beta-barrel protein [Desulfobacteraceae bacterium]|jgi:hypothetical protein|nr:outer membrane beta-barrel protein [Desulfobacteraceae bacterium]